MALIIVAAGGLLIYQLARHAGSGSTDSQGPEDVAYDYLVALQQRDCAALVDLVTESSWQTDGVNTRAEAQADCESSLQDNAPTWADGLGREDIEVASTEDGLAIVSISSAGGESDAVPQEVVLRDVDGTWLVDWTAASDTGEPVGPDSSTGSESDGPVDDVGADPGGRTTVSLPAEDVVYAFYDYAGEIDCAGLVSITTPEYWDLNPFSTDADMLDACQQAVAEADITPRYSVQGVELSASVQSGSSGWVYVEVEVDGVPETHELGLLTTDDGYLVNSR